MLKEKSPETAKFNGNSREWNVASHLHIPPSKDIDKGYKGTI